MNHLFPISIFCLSLIISGCSDDSSSESAQTGGESNAALVSQSKNKPVTISNADPVSENITTPETKEQQSNKTDSSLTESDYDTLRSKVAIGVAKIDEVYAALTEQDVVGITNTMHALHSLRWNRVIYHLYYDLWHLKKDKHPKFAWQEIESIPARIALASTITRAQGKDAEEFQNYIHAHKYDEHEFHRAQAVVALGLIGNPDDVDYIIKMANSENKYVVQSAVTSLALVNNTRAGDELIRLWEQEKETVRKEYLSKLLKQAYRWEPVQAKTEGNQPLSDPDHPIVD